MDRQRHTRGHQSEKKRCLGRNVAVQDHLRVHKNIDTKTKKSLRFLSFNKDRRK